MQTASVSRYGTRSQVRPSTYESRYSRPQYRWHRRYIRQHRAGQEYCLSPDDYCFPSSAVTPYSSNNVYRRKFLPALDRAGLRHVSLHSLRHSYASMLINQGENLKFIQSQLGHSSIDVTVDTYGHLLPETRNQAAIRLEETIFGENKSNKGTRQA